MEADVSRLRDEYIVLRKTLQEKQIKFDNTILSLPLLNGIEEQPSSLIDDKLYDDYESLYSSLGIWRDKLLNLEEKADKFRKRLQEVIDINMFCFISSHFK